MSPMKKPPGGRPFLDGIEIQLGRPLRDQSVDLELGKTDIVELGPNELRRPAPGRRVWSSSPVRLMALLFGPRIEDARIREALSLAVDRTAIHSVLLQRQGELSGALLPQWLSGLCVSVRNGGRRPEGTRTVGRLPAGARNLTLAVENTASRPHRRPHRAECP